MKNDIYQEVTDRIIEQLESGVSPWSKPWEDSAVIGMPYNRSTEKSYRGINTLLLWVSQGAQGFSSSAWLTYKQAQAMGGNVRKGEKGTKIVFFKPMEKMVEKDGEEKREGYMIARAYTVFNIDQCDDIEPLQVEEREPVTGSLMLDVAADIGARVDVEGNTACFIPSVDVVKMPHVEQFDSPEHFEATLAHELVHWTGHKSRLDRDMRGRFGDESYAAEELVAEMGAAFIGAEMGFCLTELRHAGYIEHWLKVLKSDKRAIFTAASKAQQATDFIKDMASKPAAEAA